MNKPNSFLTFCFAFIPGAGLMYLGMMRMGTLLMAAFAAVCAVGALLYAEVIVFTILPIIWFISFFQTFQHKHLSYEERLAADTKFTIQSDGKMAQHVKDLLAKRHLAVGAICVFLGAWMLISNFLFPILRRYELYWIVDSLRNVPSLFVALAIISLGVHLIRGDKKSNEAAQEDFIEYKGDTK